MPNKHIREQQRSLAHLQVAKIKKPATPSNLDRQQSNREIDRRKRQIEKGSLTASNGLMS